MGFFLELVSMKDDEEKGKTKIWRKFYSVRFEFRLAECSVFPNRV